MSLEFTMSAFALKLLGKNLYTNPWSALSELVANSLDAKALEVKLIFNKHSSSGLYDIYIIDNGTGMNEFDLENKYAKIGYPKRKDQEYMDDNTVMGRKGIGKLAALFLSNNYDILTRKDKELFYTFNFEDSINPDSDYKPRLLDCPTYKKDDIMLANIDSNNPYTCIYIKEVNFKGYAQRSFEAMANRLSYFFSYDLIKSKISISHYEDNLLSSSTEVKKKIAFKNLIALKLFGYNAIPKAQYDDLLANPIVKLPKSDNNQPLIKEREINTADEFDVEIPSLNKKGKLWGWIGIHSTIEEKDAVELNDDRFTRNLKVFNPIQLRIYVRNKLAIDDYFEVYRNTQTFSNYIEGELHFDILDDNELDDIANTNRQGMVKNDPRMIELNVYIEKMISDLILKRKNIKDELDEDKNKSIQNQNTQAKNKAKDNFETNLKLLLDSEDGTKINEDFKSKFSQRVVHNFSMQLQGEAKAKEKYSLFFSHRSKSKVFSDFVYDILIKLGADKNEIFYTSRSGRIEDLEQTIISNINYLNTMVVYFFTVFFRSAVTDYPVFEAGAGWASKSSHQVNVFLDYSKCKSDVLLYNVDTFVNFEELIKPNDHDRFFLQLTDSLNRMIQHLNKGRIIAQATNDRVNLIRELSIPNFPLSEHRPTSYNSINYIDNELKDTFENYLPLIKKYLLDNIARERFERV